MWEAALPSAHCFWLAAVASTPGSTPGDSIVAGTEERSRLPAPSSQLPAVFPKCGKLVKLFSFGTKVLFLIPQGFHPYTLEDIWPVFKLDLVF
jgi:hypothetical protein